MNSPDSEREKLVMAVQEAEDRAYNRNYEMVGEREIAMNDYREARAALAAYDSAIDRAVLVRHLDFCLLMLRHAIANKEWVIARANGDIVTHGKWQCNWAEGFEQEDDDVNRHLGSYELAEQALRAYDAAHKDGGGE